MIEKIRLQKFLANRGLASRRTIETWIKEGKILVNNKKAELGIKVNNNDKIIVNGEEIQKSIEEEVTIILNKPRKILVTREDPQGRQTIYDIIPPEFRDLKYAGRLDYDSEGLLLLTNNGNLIQKLTHPSYKVKKTYEVLIERDLGKEEIKALLTKIKLKDGFGKFIGLKKLQDRTYLIEVEEGRNRFIRRMFEKFNIKTLRLKRIAFGKYKLGKMKSGRFMIAN